MISERGSSYTQYGRQPLSAPIQTSCPSIGADYSDDARSHIVTLRAAEAGSPERVPHSPEVDYLLQKGSANRGKITRGGNYHPTDTQGHATNRALEGDSPHVGTDMKELVDLA